MLNPFDAPEPPNPDSLRAKVQACLEPRFTTGEMLAFVQMRKLSAGWAGREPPLKHRQRRMVRAMHGPEPPSWTVARWVD